MLAFAAVRAIVDPVNRLQLFARELGAGRFGTRLPEGGPPETAELARAFNASAESLQRATDRHLAELDAVFRDSPLGIAFLDLDLRFVRVNEALARMNQVPADEHLGRTVGDVTGQHEIERALREVITRGEPLLEVDIALHGRRFDASYFAVRDDRGELLAVGKAMIDVTARRRAEAARERLQQATEALAGAVTVADVAARRDRAGAARRSTPTPPSCCCSTPSAASWRSRPTATPTARRATAGGRSHWPSRCRRPRPRGSGRRSSSRTRRRCSSASRTSRASRTCAQAPVRRCRWSPTGARWACSRSASPARSPSTTTSAPC